MLQALKKVMATPRFANRRAQLAAEWEARNKLSGGSSFGKVSAAKLTRRSKAKAGSGLPPEVEKEIEEQALSEVGNPTNVWFPIVLKRHSLMLVHESTSRNPETVPSNAGPLVFVVAGFDTEPGTASHVSQPYGTG